MTNLTPIRRFGLSVTLEVTLLAMMFIGWILVLRYFLRNGYLPPPFPFDTLDDFMDWYNPAYWANHFGAYAIYRSVYPPITFLIIKIFSEAHCYSIDAFVGRSCDHVGEIFLFVALVANIVITLRAFRVHTRWVALSRALAVCLGLPMVVAFDRGNLIVVTYFFFVLGFGRILRSSRARAASVAIAINLKIYLILVILGPFLKRKWRFLEWVLVSGVMVYLITWALFGGGTPSEILSGLNAYNTEYLNAGNPLLSGLFYAGSYMPVFKYANFGLPLTQILGTRLVEIVSVVPLLLIHAGQLCAVITFLCALWRPAQIPLSRILTQAIGLVLITTEVGGYSEVFLLFALFLEIRRSVPVIVAILAGYLLCVPTDHLVFGIAREMQGSYLPGRQVDYDLGISYGMLIRPGLLLIIQYALSAASILDVVKGLGRGRGEPRALARVVPA